MATLEQLDAWGTLEQLDAYGTLEQMDSLVLHEASGTGTIALTESGTSILLHGMSASDTIAMTTTGVANYGVNISGTGSIAITESASAVLYKGFSASDTITINQSSAFGRILSPTITDADMVITADADLYKIQFLTASDTIAITTTLIGEILGETWTDVSGRTVTWSVAQ